MLQVHQLHKRYGPATILAGVSLIINDGEHVGLIGPNGAGKTTLLRCITGDERPDAGSVTLTPPGASPGYLPQTFAGLADATVGEALARAQAEFTTAERALQQAAEALAAGGDVDAAMAAYDAAFARFEALGGYGREHRAAAVLQGLGLGGLDPATTVATLSGGQKTRLGLAALLLGEPHLLLLDEPTNHLDVAALEWLEGFVRAYPGAVLVVSHDRAFLDRTVTRILYLDPETRIVQSYPGNYSDFAAARAHERALHAEAWKQQQEYIAQVEADIARLKGQALSVERSTTPRQPTVRRYAKKVAKKAKARERKLERYLESDERVEQPRQRWGLKLDFGEPPPGGRAVLRVEEVSFSYPVTGQQHGVPDIGPSPPSFLAGGRPVRGPGLGADQPAPLLRAISFEVGYGERVAIVGPNGAGKTTLLRLLAGQLRPTAGQVRLGANVRAGVLAQEQETVDPQRTVLDTARRVRAMSETEARNFLHFFLFGGDSVFRPVGACSPGERARLQLALLVLAGCNLLLLDEPLNHLDIEGREHFAQALDAFAGTVIAVAHDRAFLRAFAGRVIEVRDGGVRLVAGGYDDYARAVAGPMRLET
jgi:ATP-binding cassette subfamily F protein 3